MVVSASAAIAHVVMCSAEGNSLSLKRQFGSGYRVNISCEVEFLDEVKANVSRILPGACSSKNKKCWVVVFAESAHAGAQLVAENAGSLVYGLPDVDPDGSTARFFKYLQDKDATRGVRPLTLILTSRSLIRAFSLSMTGASTTHRWRMCS